MTTSSLDREDPFTWLEEIEGDRALDWVRAQNARSLAQLEADPRYGELHAEALAIANSQDRLALGQVRGEFLYNFWQDETHVRGLWRRSPLADYARGAPVWDLLLDFDALAAAENANWVFKGVDCLEDTSRCMVSLSDGGKDAATWREFDIEARAFVDGGFSVPEAKTGVTWQDADTLLVATDWGPGSLSESGYPIIVKRWRRGTAMAQAEEVLRGQPSDVGVFSGDLRDVDASRLLLGYQADTFFTTTFWRLDGEGAPTRITLPAKASPLALHKGFFVFTIEEAWRGFPQGALLAYPVEDLAAPEPRVTILYAPGPRQSIESVVATRDAILVAGYDNVRGRILRFAYDGRAWIESQIPMPANGAVEFAGASPTSPAAFAVFEDFLTPTTLFALEERATQARAVRALPAQFDAAPYVTEQFEAVSRDGTRVPYFLVRPRDMQLNGENPTLLYGYGGFQVSETPSYAANVGKLWLDKGGVYVLANIRGGGEFGPAWHQAGLKTNRQVVYDDFIAIAEDLIARNITSPRRLGIEGGSNGGLLMGVMLNQRPELFRAAVVQVPLLDMLRYDRLLAGASWVDEYGSPSNPEERAWLERLSPYHNLRQRDDFPVPFLVTSTKDDRVHPAHARKYAARLEQLGMPFLYYENIEGGHSAAANLNEAARRRALEYTYLAQRLMD
jgi:prolyl oligopeptidase